MEKAKGRECIEAAKVIGMKSRNSGVVGARRRWTGRCFDHSRSAVRAGIECGLARWMAGHAFGDPLAAGQRIIFRGVVGRDWVQWADKVQTAAEESALLRCLRQSRPYGDVRWIWSMQEEPGWREPQRIGRPRKKPEASHYCVCAPRIDDSGGFS